MDYSKVRNIWCVGRNYAEHAKELGNSIPNRPLIFLKAGSSILTSNHKFITPDWIKNLHYELELAVQWGENLELNKVGLAVDLTARDIQQSLKDKAQPWTLAKSFKSSSLITNFVEIGNIDLQNISFSLNLNGVQKQLGHSSKMIFSVKELSDYVLEHFPVSPNDILLTGTPKGVGPLKKGQCLEVFWENHSYGKWEIA